MNRIVCSFGQVRVIFIFSSEMWSEGRDLISDQEVKAAGYSVLGCDANDDDILRSKLGL